MINTFSSPDPDKIFNNNYQSKIFETRTGFRGEISGSSTWLSEGFDSFSSTGDLDVSKRIMSESTRHDVFKKMERSYLDQGLDRRSASIEAASRTKGNITFSSEITIDDRTYAYRTAITDQVVKDSSKRSADATRAFFVDVSQFGDDVDKAHAYLNQQLEFTTGSRTVGFDKKLNTLNINQFTEKATSSIGIFNEGFEDVTDVLKTNNSISSVSSVAPVPQSPVKPKTIPSSSIPPPSNSMMAIPDDVLSNKVGKIQIFETGMDIRGGISYGFDPSKAIDTTPEISKNINRTIGKIKSWDASDYRIEVIKKVGAAQSNQTLLQTTWEQSGVFQVEDKMYYVHRDTTWVKDDKGRIAPKHSMSYVEVNDFDADKYSYSDPFGYKNKPIAPSNELPTPPKAPTSPTPTVPTPTPTPTPSPTSTPKVGGPTMSPTSTPTPTPRTTPTKRVSTVVNNTTPNIPPPPPPRRPTVNVGPNFSGGNRGRTNMVLLGIVATLAIGAGIVNLMDDSDDGGGNRSGGGYGGGGYAGGGFNNNESIPDPIRHIRYVDKREDLDLIIKKSVASKNTAAKNKRLQKSRFVEKSNIRIVDADTLVLPGGKNLRLQGADAPETSIYDKARERGLSKGTDAYDQYIDRQKLQGSNSDSKKYQFLSQYKGNEATSRVRNLLNESKGFYIKENGIDDFDRTLTSVYTADGRSLSTLLLREGLATTELPGEAYFKGSPEDFENVQAMVEAYQEGKGVWSDPGSVSPYSFRRQGPNSKGLFSRNTVPTLRESIQHYIKREGYKSQGLLNNQYAQVLADDDSYFTLPSSLGASAHYGRTLNNSLMKQAGYINLVNMSPNIGMAETMMEYNNQMLGKEPLGNFERFIARSYDTGLYAPGLGMYINQKIFIPMGWGRVYKDEKGALPSILGLAGRILDESYLYYAYTNPDYKLIGQDYSSGLGYGALDKIQNGQGIFQSMFENIGEFAVSVAQSLGMYIAVAQPIDMFKSEIMKSFLDSTLNNVISSNTSTPDLLQSTRNISSTKSLFSLPDITRSRLAPEWFFGDLTMYSGDKGGLAAAVLKQRFWLDNQPAHQRAYFDYKYATASNPFLLQQMIERGRGASLIESTFKPFLLEFVNPYDTTTELGKKSYDGFTKAINEFIAEVAKPPDLHIDFKLGEKFLFETFEYNIKSGKVDTGSYSSAKSASSHVESYTQLKEAHMKTVSKVNKQLDKALSKLEAEEFRLQRAGLSSEEISKQRRIINIKKEVAGHRKAIHSLDDQLGRAFTKMEVTVKNVGASRKTDLAKKLQDILNRLPLNPIKWGVFSNASIQTYNDTTMFGQLFSFKESAEFVKNLLQGETSTSRIFKSLAPVDHQYMRSIDDTASLLIKAISGAFTREDGVERALEMTESFRKAERAVQTKAQKAAKKATQDARKADPNAAKVKAKGISFIATDEQAAKAVQLRGSILVESDAGDLMRAVSEYEGKLKNSAQIFDDGYDKILRSAGIRDSVGELSRATQSFNKAIGITDGLGKSTGYVAATLFSAILLNNILQSTSGASIASQLGLAIFGEDEDIAIKFQGNRFLPTEMAAEALGLGPAGAMAFNVALDVSVAGGIVAVSHNLAKLSNSAGTVRYTYTQASIAEMVQGKNPKFRLKLVNGDYLDAGTVASQQFQKGTRYVLEEVGQVLDNGSSRIMSLVVDEMGSFKTGKIAQEIATNIGTKTLIFATIGLVAINGLRESAATLLNGLVESEKTNNYGWALGGATVAGALTGAVIDFKAKNKSGLLLKFAETTLPILGKMSATKALGLGGFVLGLTAGAISLAFDDTTKKQGSLDPIVAALTMGGLGLLTGSVAISGAAALAGFGIMAAVNWAGIKFLKLGSQGLDVNEEKVRMVSTLGRFSAAVLENEKDLNAHTLAVAAWASQQGQRQSIFEKRASLGDEVISIARQSPLPFMQFFVNERVTGVNKSGSNLTSNSEGIQRVYSVGVQSGPLFGTSIAVELPIMLTPKQGFMGLSYNPNNNLMFVTDFLVNATSWAGIALGGTSAVLASYTHIFRMAENFGLGVNVPRSLTSQRMMAASKDLWQVGKFIYSAADKINYMFTKTILSTMQALYGTDVELGIKVWKNTEQAYQQAYTWAHSSELAQHRSNLSPTEEAAGKLIAAEEGVDPKTRGPINNQKALLQSRRILKYTGAFFIGAIVGASIADFGYNAYTHYVLNSSIEGKKSDFELAIKEEELAKSKTKYVIMGGLGLGLLNMARMAPKQITNILINKAKPTVVKIARSVPFASNALRKGLDTVQTIQTKVSRSKATKYIGKSFKVVSNFMKNRMGGKKGALLFAAAFAYNFVSTKSEFGLVRYMDRHILYDENGPVYDNYELQTASNALHHTLVAGTLAGTQVGILSLFNRPLENQKDTLIRYAKNELGEAVTSRTNFIFRALDKTPVGQFRIFQRNIDANRLLDTLYNLKYEAGQYKTAQLEYEKVHGNLKGFKSPEHLRKIEGAIILREKLSGDEIKEYQKLKKILASEAGERHASLATMNKTFQEADDLVKNFERRLVRELNDEGSEALLKSFTRLRGTNVARFSSKLFGSYIALNVARVGLTKFVTMSEDEDGEDSILNWVYKKSNAVGKIGQRRQDNSIVKLEGLFSVAADVLRVITKRDIIDLNTVISENNGKWIRTTGQRLITNTKNVRHAQRAMKDLSEMLIIDNPNAYIPMLNFGGKTLRRGERGVTTTSYFQLQGVGQDISAASYSMTAKFIFSQYVGGLGGKPQLASLISQATRNMDKQGGLDNSAVLLRNVTSQLHALKTSRKYSRGTSEVNAALQGDALAAMIIEARQYSLAQIGWQPVDSLFSNMFWESSDKAKTQLGHRNYVKFMSKLAKGDVNILEIFGSLMGQDLFGNIMRSSAVKNITFFSKGFKKPKKVAAERVGELASMWYRTDTIGVQMQMQEQTKSKMIESISRNIIKPITTSGFYQAVPGWMKGSFFIVGSVYSSAWALQQYASITRKVETSELVVNISERFKNMSGRKGIILSIDDPDSILTAYSKRFENTKWTLDGIKNKGGQGQIAVINKGDNSKLYIGLTDLGTSPGQHAFINFGEVIDYMDDGALESYLQHVDSHGSATKNMFMGLEVNGNIASIEHILLDERNIGKTFSNNLEKARIAHNATGETLHELTKVGGQTGVNIKTSVISQGVDDFIKVVDQAVDKIINSGSLTKIVKVDILGTNIPQEFYVHELMEHGDDIEELKRLARSSQANPQGPDSMANRKEKYLKEKGSQFRQKVTKEAESIIKEEYSKAQWSTKSGVKGIADDVGTVSEVNARALDRLTQDGTELLKARTSAGGLLQTEELGRTQSRNAAAKAAAKKPKVVHKPGSIIEVIIDGTEEALQYQNSNHNVTGLATQLYKPLGQIPNVIFSVGDVIQAIDIYAAYARVGEAYTNPYATSLDKDIASRELGRAFMTNLIGLGVGYTFGRISGGILSKLGNMRKNKTLMSTLIKGSVVVGGTAALAAVTWKNVIEPAGKAMGKYVEEHKVASSIKNAWDNIWYTSADFAGRSLAAPVAWAAQAGAPPAVLQGMSHGMGAAAGSAFLIAGLAISGIITVGLLPALGIAAGIGAIVGFGAMLFGEQMTDSSTGFLRDLKNVPYVGQHLGATVTEPYRQIRNQARFRHHFHNSPFLQGYMGDLINSKWLNVVGAAEDATGRDMVMFMFGEVLYPAEYDTSAWRKNAADSAIGGPPSLIDAVISNELKIRADHYSTNVIGRFSWNYIVEHADNNDLIRGQEEIVRAEKAAKISKAHANAKKALLSQGGPQVALNAGSARKSAVTQQQIANVEKFNAALAKSEKGSIQVTAVTVAMHKSDIENNDNSQSEQAKNLSLGPAAAALSAPITLAHQYTQRVYVDDNIMAVAVEKDTHDSNPMLQADSRAFSRDVETVAKVNSPEMKDSRESYNAYKDKA